MPKGLVQQEIKPRLLPHLLLSAACLEPLTTNELMARADRHVAGLVELNAAQKHVRDLMRRGYLQPCERRDQQRTYTLTRLGEDVLDRLGVA